MKIGIGLTAGHCIDMLNNINAIKIRQPQLNRELIEIPKSSFSFARDRKKDVGVIAFRYKNNSLIEELNNVSINPVWNPNSKECLFSLPFPGSAKKHDRIYP